MVGPGASQLVLYLATAALVDGASVFIASDTGAVTVSPLGGVALVCSVIFSVVALDSEEPIEDLLFPNVGSTSDVSSDMAFCFNERIVASTNGSKMVRVTACGMKVANPSGQSDRVPVLAPGSSVPVDRTADLAHGSEVSVIVGEGPFRRLSGHGPDRVCESSLRTCQYASSPSRRELGVRQAKFERCKVMTGSLHWVSGGTRQDESFATGQSQRKQSAPLVSDHKRAVQTTKRLRGEPETGLRFRPRPTQLCVLVYPDSALHNADANPDEEESDDEW